MTKKTKNPFAFARNANGNGNANGTTGAGAGVGMGGDHNASHNPNGAGITGGSNDLTTIDAIFKKKRIDSSGRPFAEILLLKQSIAAGGSGGAAILFESKAMHHEANALKFRRLRTKLQEAVEVFSEAATSLGTAEPRGTVVDFSHDIEAEITSCELLERHHKAEADKARLKQKEYASQAKIWVDAAKELRRLRKKEELDEFVKCGLIPAAVCILLAGLISALNSIM